MAHCYKGHPACWLFSYLFLAASFSCFFPPSMRACRTGGRSVGGSSRYIAPPSPQTQPDTGMFLFFLAALPAALHAPLQAGHKAMPSAPQPQAGRSTSRSQSQTPWAAAPPPVENPLHDLLQPPVGPPVPELPLLLGTSLPAHIHGTNPTRSTASHQSSTIKAQLDLL